MKTNQQDIKFFPQVFKKVFSKRDLFNKDIVKLYTFPQV